MTAATTRKRKSTTASTRSTAGQPRSGGGRLRPPRLPRGTGNIIGVILLVVAAFIAGYLIGRAGPTIVAAGDSFLVARVIDGDTVEMAGGSRVGYLLVDAPGPGDPWYEEATERNRQLVERKTVELVQGSTDADGSGRTLHYVYVDGMLVNAVLIEEGLARVVAPDHDELHAGLLRDLEAQARDTGRGMWSAGKL